MESRILRHLMVLAALWMSNLVFAQVDCIRSSEKYLTDHEAVLVLKEPYCKACLYDVSHYLDSVGVNRKRIIVLFESGGGGAYRLRIEDSVKEKMRIKRRQVVAMDRFDCDLLNGLYYAYRKEGEVVWRSIP